MARMNHVWSTGLALGFLSLLLPGQLQAAPQNKKADDKLKIGNGAILRRMFGDAESAKKSVEKAKTAQKEALESTRQRINNETERLKEKLGFKQPSTDSEEGDVGVDQSSASRDPNRTNPTNEPRRQFSPQLPNNRLSISDQRRNQTPATAASGIVPPTSPSSARSKPGAVKPGSPPSALPTPMEVPRLLISDETPSPRNQPRVPNQPTFAAPLAPTPFQTPGIPGPMPAEEVSDPQPQPATFGAFGIIVDAKATGLLIKAVKPKSVAAHIGLRPGDTIKNVAGLDVSVVEEIDSLVEVLEPEDEFEITFLRDGKPQTDSFSIPKK